MRYESLVNFSLAVSSPASTRLSRSRRCSLDPNSTWNFQHIRFTIVSNPLCHQNQRKQLLGHLDKIFQWRILRLFRLTKNRFNSNKSVPNNRNSSKVNKWKSTNFRPLKILGPCSRCLGSHPINLRTSQGRTVESSMPLRVKCGGNSSSFVEENFLKPQVFVCFT